MVKTEEKLETLGLKTAAKRVKELRDRKRKMAIAYEHYRFVSLEKMSAFQEKLRKSTSKNGTWKTLMLTRLEEYQEVPPEKVLVSLEKAIDDKCFDEFVVAHVTEVKDPILFGTIHGCPDHFFIDQWDDDVSIQDILKDNEG